MHALCFTVGARTDKGVGIGSTRAALRRAYGSQLANDTVYAKTDPPRVAIRFVITGGRVTTLAFAYASNILYCGR
jgi:hypothetical protein